MIAALGLGLALALAPACDRGSKGDGRPAQPEAPARDGDDGEGQGGAPAERAGETGEARRAPGEAGDPASAANDAAELLAAAATIERVELVDPEDRRVRGELDDDALRELRAALADAELRPDHAAGSPPFPLALRIHVEGRDAPFIAHPVAMDFLRLNAEQPWTPRVGEASTDLHVGMAVFDLLQARFPDELHKEYRSRPKAEIPLFEDD